MIQSVIRLATESDAYEINSVSQYLGYSALSDSDVLEKLSELIKSERDEVYVAEYSDKVVGWLHLFYACRLASDNYIEIGGLVVIPDFRGQGLGKQLVQAACSKRKGKIRVRCNDTRIESHKFYERLGFRCNKAQRVFEKRS